MLNFEWSVPATVVRVYDGDTLTCELDLGWKMRLHDQNIRLHGINAPEMNTPGGIVARDYVRKLLPIGTEVTIRSRKLDKYGRVLGNVALPDGRDLSDLMISSGHAVPYMVD